MEVQKYKCLTQSGEFKAASGRSGYLAWPLKVEQKLGGEKMWERTVILEKMLIRYVGVDKHSMYKELEACPQEGKIQ